MVSPHLTMSPSWWANAGDSVTLSCEVGDSYTGWRFSWYKAVPYREGFPSYPDKDFFPELLPDSDGGAGGSYSLSLVGLSHRERYVCRAERGDPVYYTHFSELKFLWVEGESLFLCVTVCTLTSVSSLSLSLSLCISVCFRSVSFSLSDCQSQQSSVFLQ